MVWANSRAPPFLRALTGMDFRLFLPSCKIGPFHVLLIPRHHLPDRSAPNAIRVDFPFATTNADSPRNDQAQRRCCGGVRASERLCRLEIALRRSTPPIKLAYNQDGFYKLYVLITINMMSF